MIKIFNRILLIFTLIFISENLNANFKNSILVKVGDQIITSIEVEHEIRTLLLINKREVTQEEVNKLKQPVIKSLIKRAIQEYLKVRASRQTMASGLLRHVGERNS